MSTTIFTKIINREIPAHILYEDELCIVILDAFPAVTGQTLVITKEPVSYIYDLDDETYIHVCQVAKQVAKALDTALEAVRTCTVVEGFEVPHVHIKLYPVHSFDTPLGAILPNGSKATDEDLAHLAKTIIPFLETGTTRT